MFLYLLLATNSSISKLFPKLVGALITRFDSVFNNKLQTSCCAEWKYMFPLR